MWYICIQIHLCLGGGQNLDSDMLLVKAEVLPEVFGKVVEAKRLLNCKRSLNHNLCGWKLRFNNSHCCFTNLSYISLVKRNCCNFPRYDAGYNGICKKS